MLPVAGVLAWAWVACQRLAPCGARRWVVQRTFGRLMNYRRLARDYEALPARSEAMVHVTMISLMTRRLAGESTPIWRGTRASKPGTKRPVRRPSSSRPSTSGCDRHFVNPLPRSQSVS